mgnify:CR=1 FL=1
MGACGEPPDAYASAMTTEQRSRCQHCQFYGGRLFAVLPAVECRRGSPVGYCHDSSLGCEHFVRETGSDDDLGDSERREYFEFHARDWEVKMGLRSSRT